ncbi:MAG: hypothetical protein IT205_01510 [Fimbriimonadaceae bacterium]|nr:hypothetical protein [Fimbriimonadaceae bacterium]
MKRLSKKEIQERIQKLKDSPSPETGPPMTHVEKQLSPQHNSKRIRKKGV